ncbi:hypothetical protein LINPERHAP1_LOCUS19147 [Linum perenne]
MIRMEKKEEKSQRNCKGFEPDFLLQWGTKKRLRCVRVRGPQLISQRSNGGFNKRISHHLHSNRIARNSEGERNRSAGVKEKRKSQEDRYYSTRAAAGGVGGDENGSGKASSVEGEEKSGGGVERVVWPKLYISLSSKEKEEDFLAMKGCKLPQRPKKRAKIIQRTILAVCPGAWLSDMCQERYEVREKKSSKKRPTGLKAMGSMDHSDSE